MMLVLLRRLSAKRFCSLSKRICKATANLNGRGHNSAIYDSDMFNEVSR
jgi:hypothetical protein